MIFFFSLYTLLLHIFPSFSLSHRKQWRPLDHVAVLWLKFCSSSNVTLSCLTLTWMAFGSYQGDCPASLTLMPFHSSLPFFPTCFFDGTSHSFCSHDVERPQNISCSLNDFLVISHSCWHAPGVNAVHLHLYNMYIFRIFFATGSDNVRAAWKHTSLASSFLFSQWWTDIQGSVLPCALSWVRIQAHLYW